MCISFTFCLFPVEEGSKTFGDLGEFNSMRTGGVTVFFLGVGGQLICSRQGVSTPIHAMRLVSKQNIGISSWVFLFQKNVKNNYASDFKQKTNFLKV